MTFQIKKKLNFQKEIGFAEKLWIFLDKISDFVGKFRILLEKFHIFRIVLEFGYFFDFRKNPTPTPKSPIIWEQMMMVPPSLSLCHKAHT